MAGILIAVPAHPSQVPDPEIMARDLEQIHRRLDDYERDLKGYYLATYPGSSSDSNGHPPPKKV